MSGYDSAGTTAGPATKRRRANNLDPDFYPGTAPTTSRTKAVYKAQQEAQARLAAQQQQQQLQQQQQYHHEGPVPRQPILSLASLPPDAIQRYLSRYGLLEPQGSLSYHHAVFPVPALPRDLHPPLDGRQLAIRRARTTYVPAARNARLNPTDPPPPPPRSTANPDQQPPLAPAPNLATSTTPAQGAAAGTKRAWVEPRTAEFAGLSAFDDPHRVTERLAMRATQHWDKRDSIKEAETLTNFMFSVRQRGRTLRATPAG
ncbi:hypothetical protein JCM3775_007568 [Rhodotorula graminis]